MAIEIKFHYEGFEELRTSTEMKALLKQHADRMAATANATPSTTEPAATEPYYEVDVLHPSDQKRARYWVHTTGDRAAKHEAKTQALQKSIGGTASTPTQVLRRFTPAKGARKASVAGKGRWTAEEIALLSVGLSNEEIASRTGRSVGAVVSQRYKK